jgi:inhibitor of cysteine peptidase
MDTKTWKTKLLLGGCLWLGIFFLLLGGHSMNTEENQTNMFLLAGGDETAVTVKAPGEFSLKIESNPTTGYSWWLQEPGKKEKSLLKFKEQKVEEPGEQSRPRLGAPTYEIFIFEALQPGVAVLELQYRRPWEKDVPPIKKHKVTVTIE